MPANKIVVHGRDGSIVKGTTSDFLPKKPFFHVAVGGMSSDKTKRIFVKNLKAIFFVKDFAGDKNHGDRDGVEASASLGKKIRALFKDGEIISGYSHSFSMYQTGFFLVPADAKSNNERIFIVFSSLSQLEVNGSLVTMPQ